MLSVALVLMALAAFAGEEPGSAPSSSPVPTTTSADTKDQAPAPTLQQRDPRYKLQKGDNMQLEFPYTSEFNQAVQVQPDGFINLKVVGDLHVEGETVPEVVDAIQKKYSSVLHDPVCTVLLTNFVPPYFIAMGKVNKPGKYQIYGDTTVAQAVGIAGGYTDDAKHSQVILFRRVSDDWVQSQVVDLKHMLYSGNLSEDPHIQPGDMIFVPKSGIAKVKPYIPWGLFRVNYGVNF
jgi:protein involved in polysaccharide export with SLBB domain